MQTLTLLLALSTLALSQNPIVSVFLLDDYDYTDISASVIAADASATTLSVPCLDKDDGCQISNVVVTAGPTTLQASFTRESQVATITCSYGGTTLAACAQTFIIDRGSSSTFSTTTSTTFQGALEFVPATVTAGAEKLPTVTATTTPDSTPGAESTPSAGNPPGAASGNSVHGGAIAGVAGLVAAILAL